MPIDSEAAYTTPGAVYLNYSVDGESIDPASINLQRFMLEETLASKAVQHVMHFYDPEGAFLSERLLRGDVEVGFQFGWSGQNAPRSKSQIARVIGHTVKATGKGSHVFIQAADDSLRINRGVKNRAFRNMRVSDMVTQIANEHGLTPVVEATKGILTLRQYWVSDIQYIRWYLLQRAVSSATGRGDYDFYIKDGTELHFHPADYSKKIYRRYQFGGTSEDAHIRHFIPRANTELVNALGGLEMEVRGWDPVEKKEIVSLVTGSNTPEEELLASFAPQTELPSGSDAGRFQSLAYDDKDSVDAYARVKWYAARRLAFTAIMQVIGDPLIRPGALIQISLRKSIGAFHGMSGKYLVTTVQHILKNGLFVTNLVLARSGALEGDQVLTGVQRTSVVEAERSDPQTVDLDVLPF